MNSVITEKVRPELAGIGAIIFLLFSFVAAISVSAQEIADLEAIQDEAYIYSEIKADLSFTGGYRFIHKSGDINIAEFEYLNDSVVFGGELRKFKFPHRLLIEFDFNNRKDYYGEARYSYKDIVYFRGIGRALYHNLDNIELQSGHEIKTPPPPSPPPPPPPFDPAFNSRDSGNEYGIKTGFNNLFLRFKTPDFPAHLYINANQTDKKGEQQQRSLLGSGWYNSPVRTSQTRSIDWKAGDITVGANSHLGPVEVDLSHSQKRLDVDGDKFFSNNYTPSIPRFRPAGEFPHNLIPELKGSTSTLKLHTSYTGSLVASATFTKIDRENTTSNAKSDYFIGSGEIQWMPMHKLAFFLKYSHKETDIDNPDAIPVNYLGYPSYTTPIPVVKPSISSITDTVTGTARYRPISDLTLRADYTYESIKRQDIELWLLPDSTLKHIFSLSADTKILKNLSLKARYIRKEIDDPAYNSDLDSSDEGRLSITWLPYSKISTLLNYTFSKGKRDDLFFAESDRAQNRDVKSNRLMGSITFLVIDNVALTTSYAYMSNKIEQDIVYQIDLVPNYQIDRTVPYKNTSNNYAVDINYTPDKHLNLNAGISHTVSAAKFTSKINPEITSFSALKTKDTVYSASGEYRFKNDFSLSISYKLIDFNDVHDNQYDEWKDGTAHITMLAISKRW